MKFIKFMKTIAVILIAFIVLLSLSCTRLLYLKKDYNPEIILNKKPVNIVFVNIFDYTLPDYVKDKNEISYNAGVVEFSEGLSSSLSGDKTFNFVIGDTLKKDIPLGQLTTILSKDSINAICMRHKTDMLLTLDSLNISFTWETHWEEIGKKTKDFYLFVRFYCSLYASSGELINRSLVEKSSLYKSREALSALITIKPSIARACEAIKPLAFQAGQDYVSKFYPTTAYESRKIYTGKDFKESNELIRILNWDKAIELLDQLAKSPNSKISEKARHNLSVVKEARDSR
jgi:hypothetical protein